MFTMRPSLAAVVLLAVGVAPAAGQVSTIDEGSFTITEHGSRVGREEFRIRRTPPRRACWHRLHRRGVFAFVSVFDPI